MTDKQLKLVSDAASDAHARIQEDFKNLNPVIGVNRNMRTAGIPADAMTIDCLKSGKRIIIILHDGQPDHVSYQYSFKDQDPGPDFELLPLDDVNADLFYEWMKTYFDA